MKPTSKYKQKMRFRRWYYKNKDKFNEWRKNNKDLIKKLKRKDRIKHKDKYKIRALTLKKYGKAKICIKCNSTKNVEHHLYTEPYEVDKFIDLCELCHKNIEEKPK